MVLAVRVRPRLACASSACPPDSGGRLSPTQASAVQKIDAFLPLFMGSGSSPDPARYGPVSFRFLLHRSWLARAVHDRCDGSQGTAALDRGAQHSRKSWLENRASRRAHPAVLLRGSSEDRYVHSLRNRAPGVPFRDKKRSFIDAAAFGPDRSRIDSASPRRPHIEAPTTQWKSLESNPPQKADSGRVGARRRG